MKSLVEFHEKEENEDSYQVANQEWLVEDASPAPKQRLEQKGGNVTRNGIQHEEYQGRKKQVTGIDFDFDSCLSVKTIHTNLHPPGQREGPPAPLLFDPQSQYGTE